MFFFTPRRKVRKEIIKDFHANTLRRKEELKIIDYSLNAIFNQGFIEIYQKAKF